MPWNWASLILRCRRWLIPNSFRPTLLYIRPSVLLVDDEPSTSLWHSYRYNAPKPFIILKMYFSVEKICSAVSPLTSLRAVLSGGTTADFSRMVLSASGGGAFWASIIRDCGISAGGIQLPPLLLPPPLSQSRLLFLGTHHFRSSVDFQNADFLFRGPRPWLRLRAS